uniref:Uncharacterized protein n=1 Tax=Rhizophora mucronata TaxID=61149 RepID=A0A2P2P078_RHIMU
MVPYFSVNILWLSLDLGRKSSFSICDLQA